MTRRYSSTVALRALLFAICVTVAAPAGEGAPIARKQRASLSPSIAALRDNEDRMDANQIDMYVTNFGSYALAPSTFEAGLFYPKGTLNSPVFAAGLWLGAIANASTRVAIAEYGFEYVPGPMSGGFPQPDEPPFRNYRLERGNTSSEDYQSWPVAHGAPTDSLGNPLCLGDVTIWSVYNDADPDAHFFTTPAGSTAPLGVEVRQTTFAFNRVEPMGRVIFLKFLVLNRGFNTLENMYITLWCDPDIGEYTDDLAGCDTTLALGYGFNGDGDDPVYGTLPPAAGVVLLQGPIVPVGGGVSDTLGMTSFARYPIGTDPNFGFETYNLMRGLQKDGTPVHEGDDPLLPATTFQVTGDPVTGTGWLDTDPFDRRIMVSTGPFTMAVGDSQEIIGAILIGHGGDHLASIADLRDVRNAAVEAYRAGFEVAPDIPTAIVAYLLHAEVEPDRVRLAWAVPGDAGLIGRVERRTRESDWIPISELLTPEDRALRYEDVSVEPGGVYAYRLRLWNASEEDVTPETWVSVPAPLAPGVLALRPGYPNPASRGSRWSYYVPRDGHVRLAIWDAQGRLVRVLVDGTHPSGWHVADWNGRDRTGRDAASGTYFARVESARRVETRKLIVAR